MRRSILCASLLLPLLAVAGVGRIITAQTLADASPAREPRFLLASASRISPLDVARTPVLTRRLALELEGVTLKEALSEISRQSGLRLVYNDAVLSLGQSVHLRAEAITVAAALTDLLLGSEVDIVFRPDGEAALVKRQAPPPTGTIVGRVSDAKTQSPLAGATVVVEGTSKSGTTGNDGRYRIADVTPGTYTVRARFIGYAPGSSSVTVSADQEVTADFGLERSAQQLNEVVTTGTVVPTEVKALPTPVSVISDSIIALQHPHTFQELFRQVVPTAVSWDYPNHPEQTSMSVRGTSSLTGLVGQMKVFVDGIEATSTTVAPVDPNSIERVEVIRGPEAAAIYGSDAIGGVIQIFTKRGDPTMTRPQVDAQAAFGIIQTPYAGYNGVLRQVYTGAVRGGGPDVSYNFGAGYSHTGDYLPNGEISRQSNPSVYGGVHVARGILTADVSGRYYVQNAPNTLSPYLAQTGYPYFSKPFYDPTQSSNQTFGARLSVAPTSWWRHTVTVGVDRLTFDAAQTQPRLTTPGDTLLSASTSSDTKASIGYNTSVEGPLGAGVSGSLMVGFDHYSLASTDWFASGALTTTGSIQTDPAQPIGADRSTTNNTGYFAQAQFGFHDALFVTGGLRAEQNSNFGDSLSTPVSPRVGVSYVQSLGEATLKLRSSWGRAAFDHGRYGSVIADVRWLADPTKFAFLAFAASRKRQLFLADVRTKTDSALTPPDQDVDNFAIQDDKHFVYLARSAKLLEHTAAENAAGWAVGTGRSIAALMFPNDLMGEDAAGFDLAELWAVVDGRRLRVDDKSTGRPLPLHSHYQTWLALSPDGHTAVAPMVLRVAPDDWVTRYPPRSASDLYVAKRAQQDPEAFEAWTSFAEYVSIDLATGKVEPLIDAPTITSRGWWGSEVADWSADGKSVVVSNTFLPAPAPGRNEGQARPCAAAVVDMGTNRSTCLTPVISSGNVSDVDVRFAPDRTRNITVDYEKTPRGRTTTTIYARVANGSWRLISTRDGPISKGRPLGIAVREDLNDAPVLVAKGKATQAAPIILDPNPQLKTLDLGEASVLRWKSKTGHEWVGGLYKPPDYVQGRKYPLVVQTHGFREHGFAPSGLFPSAFAARELAAAGIIVLQVGEKCEYDAPGEGPCHVAVYESGVERLVSEGLVDPDRVGIVGFSRTCYAVLATLTTGKLHYAAASIMDGLDMGYYQYLNVLDVVDDNKLQRVFETLNGGTPPFGQGMQQWLQRVPDFKLANVATPLQIVAHGRANLLDEWEPYAVLRSMKKPVDLIVLTQRSTHVLSNPKQRMISQGGTVDWMRFWLQGYEDPDPAKAEQYARWRELRKLHAQQSPSDSALTGQGIQ